MWDLGCGFRVWAFFGIEGSGVWALGRLKVEELKMGLLGLGFRA